MATAKIIITVELKRTNQETLIIEPTINYEGSGAVTDDILFAAVVTYVNLLGDALKHINKSITEIHKELMKKKKEKKECQPSEE